MGALTLAAQQPCSRREDCGSRSTQQIDRMTVGCLHRRRRGAGVVQALRATLQEAHCPYSSSAKRKIQSTPITCQYHTVASTSTWRVAMEREARSSANATISPPRPSSR